MPTETATTTDAARVAEARRWFRLLGHAPVREAGCAIVATPAHPRTWDANFAIADPDAAPSDVLAAVEHHFPAPAAQVVAVDCLTSDAVTAALALAGFVPAPPLIEMLASGPVASPHPLPAIATRPVVTPEDHAAFDRLLAADHAEGRRTATIDPDVLAGLAAATHARMRRCGYRLIAVDGVDAGYGLDIACPNRLGLVEQLFTLPDRRGRGIMSAFIVEAAARLRAAGCDGVFLDAHAGDTPKHLYARLGFVPVALTATWVRERLA